MNPLTAALSRAWSLPPARNQVRLDRGLRVPMSDGTELLADHYVPVTRRPAATVLVRTPYGRGFPYSLLNGKLIAERGYHVLVQSCRGTFGSGGTFEPMRQEAADGQDTVAWLRQQPWFDGRLATFGPSYLGFVQWALAMDPPPELTAAVVLVGPHDFSRSAYQHGAFDLYNFLSWSDMMAHQESVSPVRGIARMATIDRRLRPAFAGLPLLTSARKLLGDGAPWFEGWLEHPRLDDPFWAPLQVGAAVERITVPTLLVGGWQDLFLEQTLEQYQILAGRGVPTRLLVGPWTHLQAAGGATVAEGLAWLDRYTGGGIPFPDRTVRFWVGGAGPKGAGEWREAADWPPPGAREQRWYLGPHGMLGPEPPAAGPDARFRYDPADPTPSVGGGILALNAGVRDNQAVEAGDDVLVFSSAPLAAPVEIIGAVTAEISVTRDNPYADVFVRLCDVDPRGRSRNVCDAIVRLTDADPLEGSVRVALPGTAHRFGPGHRIRLQVAGGAHPRFARNPGNGAVDAGPGDLKGTEYRIGPGSALVLPVRCD